VLCAGEIGDFDLAAWPYGRSCWHLIPMTMVPAVRLARMKRATSRPALQSYVHDAISTSMRGVFDKVLGEEIWAYHVPLLLRQALIELRAPASSACSIWAAARLTAGRSRKMVTTRNRARPGKKHGRRLAHEKGLYDTLYVADAVDYSKDNDRRPFASLRHRCAALPRRARAVV